MKTFEETAGAFFWQMVGPLFVLCAFALAPDHLALFFLGASGLFLCAHLQMRGFVYSLLILGIAAGFEHAFAHGHHLFLLGIEMSYAMAFFVTALNVEEQDSFLDSLFSQIDAKRASITHVEEEAAKLQESLAAERIAHEEKRQTLQKEIEEMQSESSSLLVLNEVLRQTYARESLEKASLKQTFERLQAKFDALQKEPLSIEENRQLVDQLNAMRADREQARTMNETLIALYAKEQEKVREATQLLASFDREEISHLQEKVKTLAGADALYKQLREQFEEKNRVLHETRAKLFHAETELQALQIESKELSMTGIPKEIVAEISELEERLSACEIENEELQALVTSLLSTSVKKK